MKLLTVMIVLYLIIFIAGCSSQVKTGLINKIIENKTNASLAQQENAPLPGPEPNDEGVVDINSAMGVVQGSPDDIIDNTSLN